MEKGDPFPHLKNGRHWFILKILGARAGHGGPGGGQTSSCVLDKNTLTNKETKGLASKETPDRDDTTKNEPGGVCPTGTEIGGQGLSWEVSSEQSKDRVSQANTLGAECSSRGQSLCTGSEGVRSLGGVQATARTPCVGTKGGNREVEEEAGDGGTIM